MSNKNQYNHALALEKARELLRSGKCDATWAALARALHYDKNTIKQSFYREFGINSPAEILGKLGGEMPKRMGLSEDKTTYKKKRHPRPAEGMPMQLETGGPNLPARRTRVWVPAGDSTGKAAPDNNIIRISYAKCKRPPSPLYTI